MHQIRVAILNRSWQEHHGSPHASNHSLGVPRSCWYGGTFASKDVIVAGCNTSMEIGIRKNLFLPGSWYPSPHQDCWWYFEIVSDVKVVNAGTFVGSSEATLLNMLNIAPFTYYDMTVIQIFDQGNVFSPRPQVLDVEERELIDCFLSRPAIR